MQANVLQGEHLSSCKREKKTKKNLQYTLGSFVAQSLKNTDGPHVHLGPC